MNDSILCVVCDGDLRGAGHSESCPRSDLEVSQLPAVSRDTLEAEVESPAHYCTSTGLFVFDDHDEARGAEVADVLEAYGLSDDAHLWNVGKYVLRAGSKVGAHESKEVATLRDLKKAAWYLRRKIERLENTPASAKAKEP